MQPKTTHIRDHTCRLMALLFVCLVAWVSPAQARRVALVIGNETYQTEDALDNPVHDALLIAKVLKEELHFDDVQLLTNKGRLDMAVAIGNFADEARGAQTAVIYYSGHGMMSEQRQNYLLPVDVPKVESDAVLRAAAIEERELIEAVKGAEVKLVVLDACRNTRNGKKGGTKGLRRTDPGTDGLLIAYATAENETAEDGRKGSNSPYATALAARLKMAGSVPVLALLDGVKKDVMAATDSRQRPTRSGDMMVDTFLVAQAGGSSGGAVAGEVAGGKSDLAGERGAFRDCAECPPLVRIASGQFEMGSPAGEAGRIDDEGPVHRVTLRAFALGQYAVTRGQFKRFVTATGYQTDAERDVGGVSGCVSWNGKQFDWFAGSSWRDPGYRQDDSHPVVCVSWNDAQAYIQWLGRTTGQRYRLPTEAEWEYAARAGSQKARYWGDNPDEACRYANVADHSVNLQAPGASGGVVHDCDDGYGYTAPVGVFAPNAWGLYDMLGNAWQWTQDCWRDTYRGAAADGSAWTSAACESRVRRGGAWDSPAQYVRAAVRSSGASSDRHSTLGFRIARALP